MKSGFLTSGCLVLAGLLLEWGVGSVPWKLLAWPVNGFVLAIFLAVIVAIHFFRRKIKFFRFFSTREAAIPTLVFAVALTIIMGLTGWMSWPFVLIYASLAMILGLVVLKQATKFSFLVPRSSLHTSHSSLHAPHFTLHTPHFTILFHLGFFIALTSAALGSADVQRLKMIATVGMAESRAFTSEKNVKELPFNIELQRFILEKYDNGMPKRFASEIRVLAKSKKAIQTTIDVNKPVEVEGWKIYQNGYDTKMGASSRISILELVSDPWLPAVYIGIFMMLVGAFFMFFSNIPLKKTIKVVQSHPKKAFFLSLLVISVFFLVHHFMPILHSKTLVPALQSAWFVPHIVAYMAAYTLMGTATVIALYRLATNSDSTVEDRLVGIGFGLITIGMLFGALWAKEAWGHYWTWDPKETWAAITWLTYLIYIHYRQIPRHNRRMAHWLLLVAFTLLQMCWWGIRFLPDALGASVHTYAV